MGKIKTILAVTNPLAYPVEAGVLVAILVKNLFSGVFKDIAKVIKTI